MLYCKICKSHSQCFSCLDENYWKSEFTTKAQRDLWHGLKLSRSENCLSSPITQEIPVQVDRKNKPDLKCCIK